MNTTKLQSLKVIPGGITTPKGFFAGGLHAGLKKKRLDLAWCYSEVPASAACVYTLNQFQAAPLLVTKASLEQGGMIQGVIVNSGVANACTGEQGFKDAQQMQQLLAKRFQISPDSVALASTGVIGKLLPMHLIKTGIEQIVDWQTTKAAELFEEAIMTTDLSHKRACIQVEVDGQVVTIAGAAKGSGMIMPNMATMLGFITTDANIASEQLHKLLRSVTDLSFNMISVDGDTSTNDMVLALANGLAGNQELTEEHPDWPDFVAGFIYVCQELAKEIARDGEGATKLIEVTVTGGETLEAARAVGKSVIMSNLVKSAIFGTDPNWGRIVCAIGYSQQKIVPEKIKVMLGPITVFQGGIPVHFNEEAAINYLKQDTINIIIDLGQGEEVATAWGCDLSYDYIKINASYRT